MATNAAELFDGVMPFVATAEGLSLTAASRVLGVTPSAVSRAIAKLEADLGTQLLHRTARTVSLTPEGGLLYRQCQEAVLAVRAARKTILEGRKSPVGPLRVSLPLALGERVVMPRLPKLLQEHPGLSIEAVLTDRFVNVISEGFDLVVRIGSPRPSGLKRYALAPVSWATVASPTYLDRYGVPKRPTDLLAHNCLHFLRPKGSPQPFWFQPRGQKAVKAATKGNLSTDHPDGLVQAALVGLGVIQVHRFIVAAPIDEGRLVEVLHDFVPPALQLSVLYPSGGGLPPRARVFIDAMAELLGRSKPR